MRMMIKFAFPVEAGNEAMRSGKLQKIFQQLAEDLKPEASYFFPSGGERSGFFVVDMRESSQVAEIAERFLRAERQDRDDTGYGCRRFAEGPVRRAGHDPALRVSAEPVEVLFVIEPLQPFEKRRRATLAEGSAGQTPEFILQLTGFEHPILGAAFEAAPVGEPDRDRARHPGVLGVRLRHQPDAPA
jgi:hypothetical protein